MRSPTVIRVPNSKGVPLASERFRDANVRIHARMVELQREDLVRSGGDPTSAYIEWFTFHDLRRTSATRMCELGNPLEVVDRVLNHAGGKSGIGRTINNVCRVYCKYEYLPERAVAVQGLGEYVRKLVSG
jgi:hypothetical protein